MYMNELLGDLMNIDSSIPSIFSDEWNERVICDELAYLNEEKPNENNICKFED